ncbi:MAG: PAS sensor histidine kinase, partial [Halonotius sp. J07HN6]
MSDTATSPSGTTGDDSAERRMAAVPYPYVVVDPDGEITAINDRVCDRVGHDRDTLLGASLTTVLSVPTGNITDMVDKCADTGAVDSRAALLTTADEETIPVSVCGTATYDDSGEIRATHWQFHDRESAQPVADDSSHASI